MSQILNRIEIAMDTSGNVVGAAYQMYDTERQVLLAMAPITLSGGAGTALEAILGDALTAALASVTSLQAQIQALQAT